jgi:hypothetical protein
MQPYGSDRVRVAGDKIILFSRIAKGWQPRTPATHTRSEHPGTAVLWDEQYYEVIEAGVMQGGGIRYVLSAWRDEHVFRVFETYDDASEARIAADFQEAKDQRRYGKVVWLFSALLGHLPAPIQNRLANYYGVSAPRMTLVSIIPSLLFLGVCVWYYADARLKMEASPVPDLVWKFALLMLADSAARFLVVMLQNRPNGSIPGTAIYFLLWKLAPERFPSPVFERGRAVFMLEPEEGVAERDALHMYAPLITLLSPAEQWRVAERYDFEYRRHAYAPAWILLGGGLLGIVTMWSKIRHGAQPSTWISFAVAATLTIEQILRLLALRRRPAGSILAPLVRPFVRAYLA